MYDDNEQLNNLKNTAQQSIKIATEIYKLANKIQEKEKISKLDAIDKARGEILNPDKDFVFTGQAADLRYFNKSSAMPIDFVENITDENLKSAVKDQFNMAARKGLVVIDPDSQMIAITDKGRAYISKNEFKKQALDSMIEVEKSLDRCVILDGVQNDLDVFRFTEKFNLSDIQNFGSSNKGNNVMSNFMDMAKKGLVNVDKKGVVTITDKGKELLANIGGKATTKAVGALGTIGACIVVVKKAVDVIKSASVTQQM